MVYPCFFSKMALHGGGYLELKKNAQGGFLGHLRNSSGEMSMYHSWKNQLSAILFQVQPNALALLAPCWMWASVSDDGPTLAQLWFKALCRYHQHAGSASMKYWLELNGYWPATATLAQHLKNMGTCRLVLAATVSRPAWCWTQPQQTRGVEPVLVWCWANIADCGPALDQHWVNVSFLLG